MSSSYPRPKTFEVLEFDLFFIEFLGRLRRVGGQYMWGVGANTTETGTNPAMGENSEGEVEIWVTTQVTTTVTKGGEA